MPVLTNVRKELELAGYQQPRPEAERLLPDYMLFELDMRRWGYDLFGNRLSTVYANAGLTPVRYITREEFEWMFGNACPS